MSKRNLLVGIGSSHGRDQVGWQVATVIKQRPPSDCDVRIALAPADILDWLQPYQTVHICDACSGSATEPAIHRWSWPDAQVDDQAWGGTHDLSLPAVLHLATTLGMAPAEIVLWGIEVPESNCGTDDLPAIAAIVALAADRIRQELQSTADRCSHA
jgi:hydrogenase maturation protease